jgi:hypothetical protein
MKRVGWLVMADWLPISMELNTGVTNSWSDAQEISNFL